MDRTGKSKRHHEGKRPARRVKPFAKTVLSALLIVTMGPWLEIPGDAYAEAYDNATAGAAAVADGAAKAAFGAGDVAAAGAGAITGAVNDTAANAGENLAGGGAHSGDSGATAEDRAADEPSEVGISADSGSNPNDEAKQGEEAETPANGWTYRIIVPADADIRTDDHIIAKDENVKLIGFNSAEVTQTAIDYYTEHAGFAVYDGAVAQAEAEEPDSPAPDASKIEESKSAQTPDDNPIANASDAADQTEEEPAQSEDNGGHRVIALIDTGGKADANVMDAVSVIGDDPEDDNGHGTEMAADMVQVDSGAKIISIKALDSTGAGTVSSVYAAIELAIKMKANVINLSMSAKSANGNAVLQKAVDDADKASAAVVGAAGNDGSDAKDYVPANIEHVAAIGTANDEGIRLDASNYGDAVDAYVTAESTSHAAAKASAWLAVNGTDVMTAEDAVRGAIGNGFFWDGKQHDEDKPANEQKELGSTEDEGDTDQGIEDPAAESDPADTEGEPGEAESLPNGDNSEAEVDKQVLQSLDPDYGKTDDSDLLTLQAAAYSLLPSEFRGTAPDGFSRSVFDYTGGVQTFTAPATGVYTITCVGATGTSVDRGGYHGRGGMGGFATGHVTLSKGETIYIAVGQHTATYSGGWNGGGDADYTSDDVTYAGGGGGATSVTTTNRGELKNFASHQSEVIMVAGGGGGCGEPDHQQPIDANHWLAVDGGGGGGVIGQSAQDKKFGYDLGDGYKVQTGIGSGGTQTKGGSLLQNGLETSQNTGGFGYGGDATPLYDTGQGRWYGGGGGGGWYGGGGGDWYSTSTARFSGGGGGGSGHLGSRVSGGSMTAAVQGGTGHGWCSITWKTTSLQDADHDQASMIENGRSYTWWNKAENYHYALDAGMENATGYAPVYVWAPKEHFKFPCAVVPGSDGTTDAALWKMQYATLGSNGDKRWNGWRFYPNDGKSMHTLNYWGADPDSQGAYDEDCLLTGDAETDTSITDYSVDENSTAEKSYGWTQLFTLNPVGNGDYYVQGSTGGPYLNIKGRQDDGDFYSGQNAQMWGYMDETGDDFYWHPVCEDGIDKITTPYIRGNVAAGSTLSVDMKLSGANPSFTWYRSDGTKLGTGRTYKLTAADVKQGVKVTASDSNRIYLGSTSRGSSTVTIDPAGGTWSGSTAKSTVAGPDGTTTGIANPTRTGYSFAGWTLSGGGKISGTTYTFDTSNATLTAKWSKNSYYLDLNGNLDGTDSGGLGAYGTADVYVDGKLVADDVTDFYQLVPYGSKYEVKDIKAKSGKTYHGVSSGSLTGTMGAGAASVRLKFSSNPTVDRTAYVQDGNDAYWAYAHVNGNGSTIARVQFPTWTTNGGQDDIQSNWASNTAASGTAGDWTINGQTYNYRYHVAASAHKNEHGEYNTHVYAYNQQGARGMKGGTFKFTYVNQIDHWAFGFQNGEGNNGSKNAYKIATTSFNGTYGAQQTWDRSRGTQIPNGFSLENYLGSSSFDSTWTTHNLPFTYDQPAKGTAVEYDYKPVTYSISYNLAGGTQASGQATSYTVLYGVTLKNPTRTGYDFAGWYDASGKKVTGINQGAIATFSSPADMYSKLKGRTTGNQTLTAHWTAHAYTVTYEDWFIDAQGNHKVKLGSSTASKAYGSTVAGSDKGTSTANSAYYSGYQYHGSTSATVGTSGATVYRTFTATADLNIYTPDGSAQHAGTVSASTDGGKTWTTVDNEPKYTGWYWGEQLWIKDVKLKEGYDFKSVTGATKDTDGIYKMTVTAPWQTTSVNTSWHSYGISYDLGGGSVSGNPVTYTMNSEAVTLKNPTRAGWTFLGWTGSNGTTAQASVTISKGSTGNKSYKANWQANSCKVTFDANGGTIAKNGTQTFTSGQKQSFADTGAVRPGYRLLGWADSKTATAKQYDTHSGVSDAWIGGNAARTVYAVWAPYKLTVNYFAPVIATTDAQHGNASVAASSKLRTDVYSFGSSFTDLPNYNGASTWGLTAPGYTAQQYWLIGSCTASKTVDANKNWGTVAALASGLGAPLDSSDATVNIYACMQPNTYTVSYNGNGATSGSMTSSKATYNAPFMTVKNAFARQGYTFNGWNEKADGTGTAWGLGSNGVAEHGTSWTWTYTHDITLFAQWNINHHSLNMNVLAPDGTEPYQTGTAGTFQISLDGGKTWSGDVCNETAGCASVAFGATVLVRSIKPGTGMHLDSVSGADKQADGTYKLVMGDANAAVNIRMAWNKHTVTRRYRLQNADGTWGAYQQIDSKSYDYGASVAAWSRAADETYQAASIAAHTVADKDETLSVDVYRNTSTNNKVQYRLQNADGSYPATYQTGWSGTLRAGETHSWTLGQTASHAAVNRTVSYNAGTVSVDVPRRTGRLVIKANGGTGDRTTSAIRYGSTGDKITPMPSRAGYTLTGLWTAASGGTKVVNADGTKANDGTYSKSGAWQLNSDVTVYAQWTANTNTAYKVVHQQEQLDGSYKTVETQNLTGTTDAAVTPAVRTYTGFTSPAAQSATIKGDGSTTVTYKYARVRTVLDLNALSDGKGVYSNLPAKTTIAVDGTTVATDVRDFGGSFRYGSKWEITRVVPDAGYKYYPEHSTGLTGTFGTSNQSVNIALAKQYTMSYDLAGGSLTGQRTTYDYYSTAYALPQPTRTGYAFAGWTGSNGTAAQKSVTVPANSTGDRSYKATWTANGYTVKFDGNGSTGGTMADEAMTYDTAKALTANAFTRTDFAFTGWNTKADGTGTAYPDGASVSNLTTGDGGTVTLYAQWSRTHVAVNVNLLMPDGTEPYQTGTAGTVQLSFDGGKTWSADVSNETTPGNHVPLGSSVMVRSVKPETGLVLDKVTSATGNVSTDYGGAAVTAAGGTYAVPVPTDASYGWVNVNIRMRYARYTVAFDANGGVGSMDAMAMTYGTPAALTASSFTQPGYKFTGWNTRADGKGAAYADKASVSNLTAADGSIVTLYAQWSPYYLTIEYDPNGGCLASKHGSLWSQSGASLLYGGSSAHAVNDHTSGAHAVNILYGRSIDLFDYNNASELNIERTGYHAKNRAEYSLTADGTGKTFFQGGAYKTTDFADTANAPAHVKVYVNWEPNAYTLKFDPNGGKGTMQGLAMTYDKAANLPASSMTRPGWKFKGWNTRADGKGTAYADKASVNNLTAANGGTVTLYAQWELKTYTVTAPTKATWSAMSGGQADASSSYDVKVSGEFDGTVRVTGASGTLRCGSEALSAVLASRKAPLAFASTGTERDTVSVTGAAKASGTYKGTVSYKVENVL